MSRPDRSSRICRRRFLFACLPALACLLLLWVPGTARAYCLTAPAPVLLSLQQLVYQDPKLALKQAGEQRAALIRSNPGDLRRIAWLYAIEATAYSALELNDRERAVAEKGLSLPLRRDDPARLELMIQHAESLSDADGIAAGIRRIEAARALQPAGSIADICARSALGSLHHSLDHPEPAAASFLAAYRAAGAAGLSSQRAAIASGFSAVLARAGETDQALALNAEEIAWTTRAGLTYALANAQYFRGQMLIQQQRWTQALAAFARARALSLQLDDEQGTAFANMGTCEAQLELRKLPAALASCRSADRLFRTANSRLNERVTWLFARIALEEGRPAGALPLLDRVLDGDGAATASAVITAAFGTRARANAALGRYQAAYADMRQQFDRRMIADAAVLSRQSAMMRVRFIVDRQAQRNAELQRELRFSEERARQQRWRVGTILACASSIILLLLYIALASRRHRLALLRLAGDDYLTSLPNRRSINDLAIAAIADADRRQVPFAVALLDLDHFKTINDRHGHVAGDHVLQEFAIAARAQIRDGDSIGRWGGEEFLLLLPGSDAENAGDIVRRIRDAARAMRFAFDHDLQLGFSAGIAVRTRSSDMLADLILRADAALYDAKALGRDRTCVAPEG